MDFQSKGDCTKNASTTKDSHKSPVGGDTSASQITINEFLNFLKTAYQVQDSVEGVLIAGGMTDAVNWLKQKEYQFNNNHMSSQTSATELRKSQNDLLKHKLNEVLSEGLLDSILPYLIQNNSSSSCSTNSRKNSLIKISEKSSQNQQIGDRRKSVELTTSNAKITTKSDSEVEIHVCDETKDLKKTFICNQKLLTEKMGYFAEVTLGQRLEDMDISVHCDIGIFEWLMQWVKKDSLLEEDWPKLDPQCVIPILVSAAFLQMEPLLHDCLMFCHEKMNDILRTTTNLSCLNDSVLTRLAAMYTNVEVESIRDRKDKIQSRLFSKLILSLNEQEAESVRGHWNSLARVFRCEKCQQLIEPSLATKIPCVASCMRLQTNGSIINIHVRDSSWNINEYIIKLHKSLKTWRKVYWRLWGDAHMLFCTICKRYFPANQIGWCRYHPDTPQFFTVDPQRAPLPIGRYPCCGERAYKFQLLDNCSGCQFRQHFVTTESVRDSAVYGMLEAYRHLIEEEPPQLLFPERLTRLVARDPVGDKKFTCKETFWWDGLEIVPPRPKMGLLSAFTAKNNEIVLQQSEESTTTDDEEDITISTSNSVDDSSESNPTPPLNNGARNRNKIVNKNVRKLWQHNLSARCNQDIQRAYEENVIKEMSSLLNRKISLNENMQRVKGFNRNPIPIGGLWVRLESEWRENQIQANFLSKQKNIMTNSSKMKARSKFT